MESDEGPSYPHKALWATSSNNKSPKQIQKCLKCCANLTKYGAKNSLIGVLDTSRSNTQNLLAYKFDIVLRGIKQTYFENRKEGLWFGKFKRKSL